jgi:hypothetical protein
MAVKFVGLPVASSCGLKLALSLFVFSEDGVFLSPIIATCQGPAASSCVKHANYAIWVMCKSLPQMLVFCEKYMVVVVL